MYFRLIYQNNRHSFFNFVSKLISVPLRLVKLHERLSTATITSESQTRSQNGVAAEPMMN